MTRLYKILHILTVAIAASATAQAAPVTLKAAIDSTVMEQGAQTMLRLEVTDRSGKGYFTALPKGGDFIKCDTLSVDVIEVNADTTTTDGVSTISYNMLVQAFDPGVLTLPPFEYINGSDTFATNALTIKVLPVDLDSLTTINPLESVVDANYRWYDWIPDWWLWVLLGIAVAGIAVVLLLLYRKNGTIIVHKQRPVPPYELAIRRLNELRERKLAENGHEKEFYTQLTDILRQYLEGRFAINALEMSSTQILASLRSNEETRMTAEQMKQILEIADFVKFAKVRPLPDDNIKAFNSAAQFVEDTKPAEPQEGEADTNAAKNAAGNKTNDKATEKA